MNEQIHEQILCLECMKYQDKQKRFLKNLSWRKRSPPTLLIGM